MAYALNLRAVALATGLSFGVLAATAHAGVNYIGGVGTTVYGVAPYGGDPNNGLPTYFDNNLSDYTDIMTSPGGGFLTADPIIDNNIFETPSFPSLATPLHSFLIGGGNEFGFFGAGETLIAGPNVGFRLSDVNPGGGSASYSISTWTANYLVDGDGFEGDVGAFLSIGGTLADLNSAAAVSLITHYAVNGDYLDGGSELVLAAAGNGNFQAFANFGDAIMVFGPGNTSFRGLAVNNFADVEFDPNDVITLLTTLTVYADPAAIESFDLHLDLLDDLRVDLPDLMAGTTAHIPEPSAWALMILGFGSAGAALRRRRAAVI